MIGRGPIEREPEELFKRQPGVDLIFEFGIGVDAEPLLKHETFKKQQGRIGVGAFSAVTDSVIIHQDCIDSGPIDGIGDFFHQFEAAIMFEGARECEIGEA